MNKAYQNRVLSAFFALSLFTLVYSHLKVDLSLFIVGTLGTLTGAASIGYVIGHTHGGSGSAKKQPSLKGD